ncbi:hypothetical protein GGI15_003675 [Coemansia interrupta]|uniref:Nudix hydrolase domain-containing protein n=1 Tax=Coemansia interrupta TaxID=1126814 RepID=A0A9W8LHB4_9FUNG|nr:hypothetical protein GGI15_003675 [Coemansia interrupta]
MYCAGGLALRQLQGICRKGGLRHLSTSDASDRFFARLGTTPPITALDSSSIATITQRLSQATSQGTPSHLRFPAPAHPQSNAAVLLLLCTVDGQPSVLFEERSGRLNAHGGEVCFPGGKADDTDGESLETTALRETWEEVGLPRDRVRVVGGIPPVPDRSGRLRVHTVVGVLGGELDLGSLRVNREEVERAFVMPLEWFYREDVREAVRFRGRRWIPQYRSDRDGLVIWGLTAFILHEFLCRIAESSLP